MGPSTDDPKVLDKIVQAGMDVARLNFSHGAASEQVTRAQAVRDTAKRFGRVVSILVDLQGPKIRVDRFIGGKRRGLAARRVSGRPWSII